MIHMTCDQCGATIPDDVNGGARLKLGTRELVFHLCSEHQASLKQHILETLKAGTPKEAR